LRYGTGVVESSQTLRGGNRCERNNYFPPRFVGLALNNFHIIQILTRRRHSKRKTHERSPNSATVSGVKYVTVNAGLLSQRHQITNMLACGAPIAECYERLCHVQAAGNRVAK
jgi:hypothetical protein